MPIIAPNISAAHSTPTQLKNPMDAVREDQLRAFLQGQQGVMN
jgi:hypothetical protein